MLNKDALDQVVAAFDERLEKVLADYSRPNSDLFNKLIAQATTRKPEPAGTDFARLLLMEGARKRGQNPMQWATQRWGDQILQQLTVGTAIGSSTIAGGGAMVPSPISSDFIEALRAASVVISSGPRQLAINGTLAIPKMTTGSAATWIGENQNIGVSQPDFGQVIMTAKTCAVLVPIGNAFLQRAVPGSEEFVRQDALNGVREGLDDAFINGVGTQFKPKGLLTWSTNSFAANATFNGTNAAADLSKVIGIVKTGLKRDPVRGGWLLSCREEEALRGVRDAAGFAFRDEMTRGMLMGYPYKASSLVPSTGGVGTDESSIIFCDWDAVVVGSDMNLQIDSSTDATVTDSGGATVSAFQQNLTLVRVIAETDLVVRHAAAVCHLTTVKWGE